MAETEHIVSLDAFLARLTDEDAAELRALAAQIDALEREVGPPNWIERNILWLGAAALALFGLGLAAFIGGFTGMMTAVGLGGVVLMVAGFPALIFAYLLSVRSHTRIDDRKMELNEKHFLPRGGVYFGAAHGDGKVLLVAPPAEKGEPDLRSKVHAQYKAATKWKW